MEAAKSCSESGSHTAQTPLQVALAACNSMGASAAATPLPLPPPMESPSDCDSERTPSGPWASLAGLHQDGEEGEVDQPVHGTYSDFDAEKATSDGEDQPDCSWVEGLIRTPVVDAPESDPTITAAGSDDDFEKTTSDAARAGGDEADEVVQPWVPAPSHEQTAAIAAAPLQAIATGETRPNQLRPEWLPAGWYMHAATRQGGATRGRIDKYFYSPGDHYRFRSKVEVMEYLATGQLRVQRRPSKGNIASSQTKVLHKDPPGEASA